MVWWMMTTEKDGKAAERVIGNLRKCEWGVVYLSKGKRKGRKEEACTLLSSTGHLGLGVRVRVRVRVSGVRVRVTLCRPLASAAPPVGVRKGEEGEMLGYRNFLPGIRGGGASCMDPTPKYIQQQKKPAKKTEETSCHRPKIRRRGINTLWCIVLITCMQE